MSKNIHIILLLKSRNITWLHLTDIAIMKIRPLDVSAVDVAAIVHVVQEEAVDQLGSVYPPQKVHVSPVGISNLNKRVQSA